MPNVSNINISLQSHEGEKDEEKQILQCSSKLIATSAHQKKETSEYEGERNQTLSARTNLTMEKTLQDGHLVVNPNNWENSNYTMQSYEAKETFEHSNVYDKSEAKETTYTSRVMHGTNYY